jgi:dihydrodipicolinate synthase/N-acetylneuraminate lyase
MRMTGSDPLGAVPVVPIPFTPQEHIDEDALRAFVEHAVRSRLRALCLPAYGSEYYKLSEAERGRVVKIAVDQARQRILVIAQGNHGSARVAAEIARANAAEGAGMISIAIPRQFPLPDPDLLDYLAAVMDAVDLPFLVQDFNPGGPTVQPKFVAELRRRCSNLRYLKLEEPAMAAKVRAIQQATDGQVEILEGWGGLYVLELTPAGIAGLMPGLALADILDRVFHLRRAGDAARSFAIFEKILPQILFSLQNMEIYLYCEKRLLRARGLLDNERRRAPAFTLDPDSVRYVDELNDHILETLTELKLPAAAVAGS